jgi:hypothetical protein
VATSRKPQEGRPDDDFEARREALIAGHGQPRHVSEATACRLLGGAAAGLNMTDMLAFRYPTREAARAFHQLNHDEHGHASLGIVADPDGTGVIGVMDIRKKLAEMRARHEAQQPPGRTESEQR